MQGVGLVVLWFQEFITAPKKSISALGKSVRAPFAVLGYAGALPMSLKCRKPWHCSAEQSPPTPCPSTAPCSLLRPFSLPSCMFPAAPTNGSFWSASVHVML